MKVLVAKSPLLFYLHLQIHTGYSQVPIKQVGPNKRVVWVFCQESINDGLDKGNSRKAVLNKRVEWKISQ